MESSPWRLVLQGQYQEAVDELTHQLDTLSGLMRAIACTHRARAYLGLRDYNAAAHDFEQVILLDPASASGYLGLGVCLWCQLRPFPAVSVWMKASEAAYTDAAGGVVPPALLLYAALRMHDHNVRREAIKFLRKRSRRKQLVNWPGAIVPFLLGKIPSDEFMDVVTHSTAQPILAVRHRCQADFYRGVRGLEDGDRGEFENGMWSCAASTYGFLESEFYLAVWEVEQHFPNILRENSVEESLRPES